MSAVSHITSALSQVMGTASVAQPIPSEVEHDVRAFLKERYSQTDHWFFLVRMVLTLGVSGYFVVDVLSFSDGLPTSLLLLSGYAILNLLIWAVAEKRISYTRWLYAALDLTFLLLLRHLVLFELFLDPNATLTGFLMLILIAYTLYGDPAFSATLALTSLTVCALSAWFGDAQLLNGNTGYYQNHPMRALLLFSFLMGVGYMTYFLAMRLRNQVTSYSTELHKRMRAALATAVERARRERLEDLNRLKEDFIAVLSHELRTPIAPLRTSLEIAAMEVEDEDVKEMLDIAVEAATRLHRLVDDYTHLAELLTLDEDQLLVTNVRVDTLVHMLLGNKTEHTYATQDLPQLAVATDPRLLSGAILALIRRAESVTTEHDPITLYGYSEDDRVVIAVHDPKSFIASDAEVSLDDPFAAASERVFSSPNTGMELILAQHSVRRVGGELQLKSDKQNGTTVYCMLPKAPQVASPAEHPNPHVAKKRPELAFA